MIRFRVPFLLLSIASCHFIDAKDVQTNSSQDLTAAASEFSGPKYLPPHNSFRGRSCYDCNNEPWVPIIGRSLQFPISSQSNHLDNIPHFREIPSHNKQFNVHSPPIDHYGAPQGTFNYPPTGEVVEFMLPPPIIHADTYGPPKPKHHFSFGGRKPTYSPPRNTYGPPSKSFNNYGPPTTYLRPVSQDISPPLPPINQLPLDNHMPPPVPSDSYGRPVTGDRLTPPPPGPSYLPAADGYAEPITLGSGDSEEYGHRIPFNLINVDSRFNQKGLSDVQVVPSVRVADYTASIEHPINLIQSPILDLNVNDQQNHHTGHSSKSTLNENPIVVEDSFTSASDVNSTFAATAFKRDNDEYLNADGFVKSSDEALTDNLIQKLLMDQDVIKDSKKQHWAHPLTTKLTPTKHANKLQIIVPYLKSTDYPRWTNKPIYNKEYTTLAPVFVPPPITTEAASLWTKLVEDLVTADIKNAPAQGFAKTESTTKVYNIAHDMTSLQKNIDDWTHQSYANQYHFGEKLTTKLAQAKQIPNNFFSTTSNYKYLQFTDNTASGSEIKQYSSPEITDNLIIPDETTTTSTKPSIRFVKKPKPTWESTKVTLSNSTHEKVYVVTPESYTKVMTSTPATAFSMAPKIQNGKINNVSTMTKISVRVEAPQDEDKEKDPKPVKVVYSEWPHLINDLVPTTTVKSTTRHPLFGLMDLAPFTASPNTTVETISGYSKA